MILTAVQADALRDLVRTYDAQEADVIALGPRDLGVISVDLYADNTDDAVAHATISPGGTVREASRA